MNYRNSGIGNKPLGGGSLGNIFLETGVPRVFASCTVVTNQLYRLNG